MTINSNTCCDVHNLPAFVANTWRGIRPYAVSTGVVALVTVLGMHLCPQWDEENIIMLYLLAVVLVAYRYGNWPALFSCILSVSAFDLLVLSPKCGIATMSRELMLTIVVMFLVALWMGQLTARIKTQNANLEQCVQARTQELSDTNAALKEEVVHRKKAEFELQRTVDELMRSNVSLSQFARIASHDLQEPLRSLRGYTDLLTRRYHDQLDDVGNEFIDHINECGNRMERLISGILAHAKITAKDQQFQDVDTEDILAEVLSNLDMAIVETGARISYGRMPRVMADPLQLIHLFQNILSNALKFRGDRTPEISVTAARKGKRWQISITDNGIGIEAKHIHEIFGMFKRLHSDSTYPGTGMGLAICKSIVEKHDGCIWVESEPGRGSTFNFKLLASTIDDEEDMDHEQHA